METLFLPVVTNQAISYQDLNKPQINQEISQGMDAAIHASTATATGTT